MRKIIGIAVLVAATSAAGNVHAYELVRVVSGDELLVTENGRELRLELAGVWVPAPPGAGIQEEYRGAEARRFVEDVLHTLPAYIKELDPVESGAESVDVRIRVGERGEHDLAVLLAEEGLGLVDRASSVDSAHAEAIYRAERLARLEQRGMHDGGYIAFERRSEANELNLGIGVLAIRQRPRNRENLRAYLEDRGQRRSSGGSDRRQSGIHKDPQDAIRDWGSKMGLPKDNSNLGR